jgi:hypothetical protein
VEHNAHPPDFEVVLVQDEPVGWVNTANLTLLGELRRRAPHAIDWAGLRAAGTCRCSTISRRRRIAALRAGISYISIIILAQQKAPILHARRGRFCD